jgi:hypothetical protein
MENIFELIRAEREALEEEHHSTEDWAEILTEDVGEVVGEAQGGWLDMLRDPLLRIAAVAVCWLEALSEVGERLNGLRE